MVEFERDGKVTHHHAVAQAVPHVMCMEKNFDEVIEWYLKLRETITKNIRYQRINRPRSTPRRFHDFSQIQEITPSVALMIASEYDRLQLITGAKLGAYNKRDWRPEVSELLEGIGFFDLLDIQLASVREESETPYVRIARFKSGDQLEPDVIGPFIKILVEQFLKLDPDALLDSKRAQGTMQLFGALVEATENTLQHAYTEEMRGRRECATRWWLTGAAYPSEKRLTLVVYDHGVTIPAKLNDGTTAAWSGRDFITRGLRRLFGRTDSLAVDDDARDAATLRLAMGYGRSSTGAGHRGKGLPAIQEAVRHCRRGRLLVQSRRGEYIYQTGSKSTSRLLPVALPGTMIVWDLWL